jgi:AhpD family alkylhydroperoxidase
MTPETARFFEQWEEDQPRIRKSAPTIARAFGGLFQTIMAEGALSVREKELIALGIAIADTCRPCINLHVQKCLTAGASSEQVLEATGVAVMMRGGPAFTHVPEVMHAIEHLTQRV